MAIADDFSVALNGDIRYTGTGTNYTVLELHRYLQDLADDAQASGDDLVDIVSFTPSERATDNIITLLDWSSDGGPTYNIDDTAAEHLYDGSITQGSAGNVGTTVYSGLEVVGNVVSGTELIIVQDDNVLSPYWGTGINPDAANAIIMRLMVKTRVNGADINGKRLRVIAAELGDTRAAFNVTAGVGIAVAAVFTSSDLNNQTAEATIRGWSTIDWTEGFQLIDITGDAVDEEYYIQFDIGSQSVNDTYEFAKMVQARESAADSATETGTNYVVDNATITGQAQEFTARTVTAGVGGEKLTGCTFQLKVGGGTPTGLMHVELIDSDDASPAIPTGGVLATSDSIDVNRLTATYQEVHFRFNDNVTLTNGQTYFLALRHPNGSGTNFIHVEGDAADGASHPGNRAEDSGGWTGSSTSDLTFEVFASPVLFGRPGVLHRGVTHEVVYDTESGAFSELEELYWGTEITYDTLVGGPFTVGEYVRFDDGTDVINGGKVLADSGTVLTVALENLTQNLSDNDNITGLDSGATAAINVTITDDNRAGGEGILVALDDNGTTGDFYIQLISGAAPVDNLQITGRTSTQTALVNVTVTARPLSGSFIGQSTGTNIIGAYGVAFQPTDVGASDQFFDLTNTLRQPPNNVTFTVTGLVSGEDRVLVGPRLAGVLDTAQFGVNTTLSGTAETSVVFDATIPSDTPSAGEGTTLNSRLRVQLDGGVFKRQPYSSYTGTTATLSLPANSAVQIDVVATSGTFTRASGDFLADGFEPGARFTGAGFANGGNNSTFTAATVTTTVITVVDNTGMVNETGSGDETLTTSGWDYSADNATAANDLFIAYIDTLANATSESFTAVYSSDRDLFVRVRDGGSTPIRTFESPATFGSSNSSIAAIRTSDA